jgi:hypothetical protein
MSCARLEYSLSALRVSSGEEGLTDLTHIHRQVQRDALTERIDRAWHMTCSRTRRGQGHPTVAQRVDDLKQENPDVPAGTPIPVDLVTASGSGLDPDVSVAAAYYQIPRVATARHLSQDAVRHIVDAHVQGRFLGVFGEPRINVLELNLALNAASHRPIGGTVQTTLTHESSSVTWT